MVRAGHKTALPDDGPRFLAGASRARSKYRQSQGVSCKPSSTRTRTRQHPGRAADWAAAAAVAAWSWLTSQPVASVHADEGMVGCRREERDERHEVASHGRGSLADAGSGPARGLMSRAMMGRCRHQSQARLRLYVNGSMTQLCRICRSGSRTARAAVYGVHGA